MSQPSDNPIYIPPFSGVRLVEYRDQLRLVPVPDVRKVYGYGKIRAAEARIDPDDPESEQVCENLSPVVEVWVVSCFGGARLCAKRQPQHSVLAKSSRFYGVAAAGLSDTATLRAKMRMVGFGGSGILSNPFWNTWRRVTVSKIF